MKALRAMAALLVLAVAGRASAATIVDPNDPSLGASPITVDFESALPGTYPAYAGGLTVDTAAGPVNFLASRLQITSTYAGQYNTTGQYLSSEGYLFRNLIITFPSPVTAFGMNLGLTDQPWEIDAFDAAGNAIEVAAVPAILGSNAGEFYGIASATPIAQAVLVVQIPVKPGALWVVVDNLKFAPVAVPPPPRASVSVGLAGNGSGSVASSPAGIDCGTACSASFDVGTALTLGATPGAGSFFGGWGGDCAAAGSAPSASLALDADKRCTATFHLLAESADLAVSASQATARPRAGRRLAYRLTVENRGPAVAPAAVLAVSFTGLSAGDEATIEVPDGCTRTGATLTCALRDLAPGRRVRRTTSLVPSSAGVVGLSAAASSGAPDPDAANSRAELTTVVP